MKVNNKIPWGLVTGALGITTAGIFNGTAMLGIGSVVVAPLARQQIEKKKLKPELALKLR